MSNSDYPTEAAENFSGPLLALVTAIEMKLLYAISLTAYATTVSSQATVPEPLEQVFANLTISDHIVNLE